MKKYIRVKSHYITRNGKKIKIRAHLRKHPKYAKIVHFKSEKDYEKWLAYNWIHNKKAMGKAPHKKVYIKGKPHKVVH